MHAQAQRLRELAREHLQSPGLKTKPATLSRLRKKAWFEGHSSSLASFSSYLGLGSDRTRLAGLRYSQTYRRIRQPRTLTVEEFQKFIQHLGEPFRTMALLSACLGLRISECLALQWSDVDWLNGRLRVERRIVCQQVDDVKTNESRRQMAIDHELLEALMAWKQASQCSGLSDWMFASPVQLGRLPWSYDQVWRKYQKAAIKAGILRLGTHGLRQTYRSWLDCSSSEHMRPAWPMGQATLSIPVHP